MAGKLSYQIEADSLNLIDAFRNELFYSNYDFNEASIRKLFIPNTYEVYWTITPLSINPTSPGQGALACEVRTEDTFIRKIMKEINKKKHK